MRRPVDTHALTAVGEVLRSVGHDLAAAEDDLLSCLVVLGEPGPQRAFDAWVDEVADVLRAVDEVAAQHRATLARSTARRPAHLVDAPVDEPVGESTRPGQR